LDVSCLVKLIVVLSGMTLTQHSCDPLRCLRTAVFLSARKGRLFALPYFVLDLSIFKGLPPFSTLIRLLFLGLRGLSPFWVLYMGS